MTISGNTPIDESIGYLISRAATDMRAALDRALSVHGISSAQWVILARVAREPGCTPAELSTLLHISRPAVTGLLDRMEAAGWLVRRRSESDGRSVELRVTPAAKSLLARVPKVVGDLNERFTQGLSEAEKASLGALLGRVINNVGQLRET